ncbi:MAG: hypothetical protein NC191_03230 [Muribaculaceae bacterium]|nr:hypothetical protein [Muribaculaceae bacterium]
MKHISINKEQMEILLKNKELNFYPKDDVIEISEDNIRLNENGTIYKLKSVDFVFERRKLEYEQVIINLRKLLCDYLNLSEEEVIFRSTDNTEYIFDIRFSPTQEVSLMICFMNSIRWSKGDVDENKSLVFNETQLGHYRKIGNSGYVFRWLTGII